RALPKYNWAAQDAHLDNIDWDTEQIRQWAADETVPASGSFWDIQPQQMGPVKRKPDGAALASTSGGTAILGRWTNEHYNSETVLLWDFEVYWLRHQTQEAYRN